MEPGPNGTGIRLYSLGAPGRLRLPQSRTDEQSMGIHPAGHLTSPDRRTHSTYTARVTRPIPSLGTGRFFFSPLATSPASAMMASHA